MSGGEDFNNNVEMPVGKAGRDTNRTVFMRSSPICTGRGAASGRDESLHFGGERAWGRSFQHKCGNGGEKPAAGCEWANVHGLFSGLHRRRCGDEQCDTVLFKKAACVSQLVHYNFSRILSTLRTTLAKAAGFASEIWPLCTLLSWARHHGHKGERWRHGLKGYQY